MANLISLCSRMSRQLWVVKLPPRPPLPSRPPRKRGGSTKTARPQLPQLLLPRLIPQTRYQSAHQTHLCFCLEANLISLHSLLSSLSQVAIRQNVTHLLESFWFYPCIWAETVSATPLLAAKKNPKMIPEVVFHIVIGHLWQWWEVSYTKSLIIPRTEIVR